jgi:DNA-binding winged helix-turn-helix (wHTH) protein
MPPSKYLANVLSFYFGPFRFIPSRKLLLCSDSPVEVGDRARAVLLALVERPGEIIACADIVARVWSRAIVGSGTLRVHIAALRKALARCASEPIYIENIHGHGYRFAVPVRRICVPTELFGHAGVLHEISARLRHRSARSILDLRCRPPLAWRRGRP